VKRCTALVDLVQLRVVGTRDRRQVVEVYTVLPSTLVMKVKVERAVLPLPELAVREPRADQAVAGTIVVALPDDALAHCRLLLRRLIASCRRCWSRSSRVAHTTTATLNATAAPIHTQLTGSLPA